MTRLILTGLVLLTLVVPGYAAADLMLAERANSGIKSIFQGGQGARIGNQQAASRAKRSFPGNKVLSVKLIESSGPPVYRIKMLSDQGVVKFVFVDGTNGEVFE